MKKICVNDIIPEPKLNKEQQLALDLALQGKSLFITGSAGTGKSFLLKKIHKALCNEGRIVAVTATTGVAAVHVNGQTIHSFSGLGIAKDSIEATKVKASKPWIKEKWREIDVLLIDEISMMLPDFFQKLSVICRHSRSRFSSQYGHFGGIQLIVFGDFFQLPPVHKSGERNESGVLFAFELDIWKNTFKHTILLKEIFRQNDTSFIDMLQRIRQGTPTDDDIQNLKSRVGLNYFGREIQPTKLTSHRSDEERINRNQLELLTTEQRIYDMKSGYENQAETKREREKYAVSLEVRKRMQDHVNKNSPPPVKLILKVGAQVMLLANISVDMGLVNGSRGVIKMFDPNTGFPIVKFKSGLFLVRPYMWKFYFSDKQFVWTAQIPLKLAYAITIHKSQGQTIDSIEMALDEKIFAEGQAYVALSRVKSIQDLYLTRFHESCIRTNSTVKNYYSTLESLHF